MTAALALARGRGGEGEEWPAAVWAGIWSHLTPRQQQVVYLHVLVGLSHTAVAHTLGLSRGTVLGAWGRALARIRDALPAT